MPYSKRDGVFVSYSHADEDWLDKLRDLLGPSIRNHRIEYWDDRSLETGVLWAPRIRDAIARAFVAVLFVSPRFLASRFIVDEELPQILRAIESGLTLLWVPVAGTLHGPHAPEEFRPIAAFQAAIDPSRPLADRDATEQVQALEEVARQIHRLLEPSRTPRNLPFLTLGTRFKGRDEDLATLETSLRRRSSMAIVQPHTISGLGGIGKTRLALEYAWRHERELSALLFVFANTPDELDANLARLSDPEVLDLPEYMSSKQDDQRAAVVRWLQQNSSWLLIIDNVDTEEAVLAVQSIVPRLGDGFVIITSRLTQWDRAIPKLSLDVIPFADSVALLLEASHYASVAALEETRQAEALAERLGGLPLALTHAAAYIDYSGALRDYIAKFDHDFDALLRYHDPAVIDYATGTDKAGMLKTVATTFFLSFDRLPPLAKAILRAMSFLAPAPIPVALFEASAMTLGRLVQLYCKETGENSAERPIGQAFSELARFSLITRTGTTVSVHRMVQKIIRGQVPPEFHVRWAQEVLSLILDFAPKDSGSPASWPVWELLRAHLELLCRSYLDHPGVVVSVELPRGLARFFKGKGLSSNGIPYAARVLDYCESHYEIDHHETLEATHQLGLLFEGTGRYADAEHLYRRELAGRERTSGKDAPTTLNAVNRLACLLGLKYEFEEAERLFRRAINGRNEILGEDSPDTLKSRNDLGWMLSRKGDEAAAEPLLRQALTGLERVLGPTHRDTLASANNLALILQKRGDLDGAEALLRRAVDGLSREFGTDHPDTLICIQHLASVLEQQGHGLAAEALEQRAVAGTGEVLLESERLEPEDNLQLAVDLNNKALELRNSGQLAKAELLLRRALAIDEDARGSRHPKIPHRLNNLCTVLILQGKLDEAERYLARAWSLEPEPGDLTSARILFVRLALAMLRLEPGNTFMGQLKTMLTGKALPILGDVSPTWDMTHFIESLRPQMRTGYAELLSTLAAAIGDHGEAARLGAFEPWSGQESLPLDIQWPRPGRFTVAGISQSSGSLSSS